MVPTASEILSSPKSTESLPPQPESSSWSDAVKLGENISASLSEAKHDETASTAAPQQSKTLAHPSDISARLDSSPQLAALRASGAQPLPDTGRSRPGSTPASSQPTIIGPICSGYFVEPVRTTTASCFAQNIDLCTSDEMDGFDVVERADHRKDYLS